MNKTLSLSLISALTLMLSTGCNSTSGDGIHVKSHDNEEVLHAIEKSGKQNGWKITEFKNNEVIAEKTDDGETISSTIKFHNGDIKFSNSEAASDLSSDIIDIIDNSPSASNHKEH